MAAKKSLKDFYNMVYHLEDYGSRSQCEQVRSALIPEEKISNEEFAELQDIEMRMKRGEKVRLQDALEELNF